MDNQEKMEKLVSLIEHQSKHLQEAVGDRTLMSNVALLCKYHQIEAKKELAEEFNKRTSNHHKDLLDELLSKK